MILQSNQFGDLGWGWKSVTSAAKKVGRGTYSVAKMPAGMAKRVAAASASVLCDKDGNPRGTDSTSVNYCRAVKLKRQASLTKYLPSAAAAASKATAVQQAYANTNGFGTPPKLAYRTCFAEQLSKGFNPDAAKTLCAGLLSKKAARSACIEQRRNQGYNPNAARGACAGTLRSSDPDTNLLASLNGADLNELAYALAGVTPTDISGVTMSDAMLFVPSALAMVAGFWMATRG